MRDLIFIVATLILTWIAVSIAIELLGETIIEDIVKGTLFVVFTTILPFTTPKFEYVYICTLIAAGCGIVMNQINQFVANRISFE